MKEKGRGREICVCFFREGGSGLMNQLVAFVVQMLLETVTARETCDWWAV